VTVTKRHPQNQDDVLPSVGCTSCLHKDAGNVTVVPSAFSDDTLWLSADGNDLTDANAATGATVTKATNGSTIVAPSDAGVYHLYIKTAGDIVSSASAQSVIVDTTLPAQSNCFTAAETGIVGGRTVALDNAITGFTASGSATAVEGWLLPATVAAPTLANFVENGTTITKAYENNKIKAPTTAAEYSFWLKDAAGNIAAAADTDTVTVATAGPTGADAVLTADVYVRGTTPQQAVTINAPDASLDIILALPTASLDNTTVTAVSDVTVIDSSAAAADKTSILAPTDATIIGYKIFLRNSAGAISAPSTASVFVDNTPPTPTFQSDYLKEDTLRNPGVTLPFNSSAGLAGLASWATSEPDHTVWLAPANQTAASTWTAGDDRTSAQPNATSIVVPTTVGIYYLYVRDRHGNVSQQSTQKVEVAVGQVVAGGLTMALNVPSSLQTTAALNGNSPAAEAFQSGMKTAICGLHAVPCHSITDLTFAVTSRRRLREMNARRLTATSISTSYQMTLSTADVTNVVASVPTAANVATAVTNALSTNSSFALVVAAPPIAANISAIAAPAVVTAPAAASPAAEEDDSVVAIVILLLFIFVILPITICVVCTYCVAQAATEAAAKEGEKEGEDAEAEENEEDAPAVQV
jgi:hypothetical protein